MRNLKESPKKFTSGPFNNKDGESLWLFRQLPDGTLFTATNARSNVYDVWARKTGAFTAEVVCPVHHDGVCNTGAEFRVSHLTVVRISDSDMRKYEKSCE